jgi:uncharacterized membrane protein YgdD (TMEM256/DUF423 family)
MPTPPSLWTAVAGLAGFLAVALGAFGAHGLAPRLQQLGTTETWHTGALYHLVHAVAALALMLRATPSAVRSGQLMLAGVLVFSGSLYLLAFTGIRKLGMITPIGGVLLLVGWGVVVWAAWQGKL